MSEKICFVEPHQIRILEQINTDLFGDGRSLDPDKRRDMANQMFVILEEIKEQETTE